MKFCDDFAQCPLPYLMLVMIAGVSAFVAWLGLGTVIPEPTARVIASTLAFATAGSANLLYIHSCLRRYPDLAGGQGPCSGSTEGFPR